MEIMIVALECASSSSLYGTSAMTQNVVKVSLFIIVAGTVGDVVANFPGRIAVGVVVGEVL